MGKGLIPRMDVRLEDLRREFGSESGKWNVILGKNKRLKRGWEGEGDGMEVLLGARVRNTVQVGETEYQEHLFLEPPLHCTDTLKKRHQIHTSNTNT